MIKQYIIVRKDLPMSAGKLAAQVSHASIAFLTRMISKHIERINKDEYEVKLLSIDKDLWEGWMCPESSFTKVVLETKNKNQLNKIINKAIENGLVENEDFFCIHDEGRTELDAYRDEDGKIFTCIGFRPIEEEKMKPIVGKLQIYKK